MQRRTRRPSPSLVVAVIALVVAVAGGGQAVAGGVATAAKLITGKQIKDGSLTLKDFKASDRTKLRGAAGAAGVAGPAGSAGAAGPAGPAGVAGAAGTARAYGLVAAGGALSKSKGIAAVTTPAAGRYCIKLDAGISVAAVEAVATLDFATSSNGATVQVNQNRDGCPGVTNFVEVTTGQIQSTTAGTDATEVAAAQGFFVVVP